MSQLKQLEEVPWTSVFGVAAALLGAVVVIVHPQTLSYPAYMSKLAWLLAGAGALGIARTKAGKGTESFIAVLDNLPWAAIIGLVAAGAGAVVVVAHPASLNYSQWLEDAGKLLLGTGVFGYSRSLAGRSVRQPTP